MFCIIDDNFLVEEEEKAIVQIPYNEDFPLFFGRATSDKFQYFSHSVKLRETSDVVSGTTVFFEYIVKRFCHKHSIPLSEIIRMNINVSFNSSKYETYDPHVDNVYDHKVLLLYLNDLPFDKRYNSTIIFEETYDKSTGVKGMMIDVDEEADRVKNMKILKEVYPKYGRILCFDGKHYHTNRLPEDGHLRYVFVANFR